MAFRNCIPFSKCITKIDGTTIDNAEELNLVIDIMYNLLECNSNYSDTTSRLWFYSKDEATNVDNNIANTSNFKSLILNFKAKLLKNTVCQLAPNNDNEILKNAKIAVL